MSVNNGTFLIINADSMFALDVANASDAWGANIALWSVLKNDAQIWAVTQHDNGYQLICSLTGKSADVENADLHNGANIRQWEDNDANCQRWDLELTGNTAVYDGGTYSTFVIKAHGTNFCIDGQENATLNPQTNVLLWTHENRAWQEWIFVPVSCFTEEGTYAIRSALEPSLCVDIANAATGAGANALAWPYSGANNEIFQTVVNEDSLTVKLVATHSNKALDVDHGAIEDGRNVLQWDKVDDNPNQEWMPFPKGTITVNGATVPTYALRNQSSGGTSRVMDIYGGSKTPGTNLVVWEELVGTHLNQQFWFEKTEMTGSGISIPTAALPQQIQADGPTTFMLHFTCDEDYYQARYRIRTYSGKDREKYQQTAWMNVKDDSKTNDGWGPAWTYSFTRDELYDDDNGYLELPVDFTLDVDGATEGKAYAELGLQVRAFKEDYGETHSYAHGQIASTTVRIAKNPTINMDPVDYPGTGLFLRTVETNGGEGIAIEAKMAHDVPLSKSFQISGRLVDANGKYISEIVTVIGYDPETMSLVWPTNVLRRLPEQDEEIGVAFGWRTSDGGYTHDTLKGTVNFNISQGVQINIEDHDRHDGSVDDTWTDFIMVNAHESDWCWLAIERGSGVEMFECPTILSDSAHKTFKVLPPLNKDYRLIFLARDSYSRFGMRMVTMPALKAHVHTWAWRERYDETANLHVSEGSRPKQTRNYDSDSAIHTTTGRRHPTAWAHRSVSVDLSVEGSTYFNDTMRYSQDEDFERLTYIIGEGEHPVYRTPRGDWYRVVVKGVDNPYQDEWGSEVKVSQEAVTV